MKKFREIFERGLVVSCQASEGDPLYLPGYMARMALAAEMGGAVGIRANKPADIRDIKATVSLPVIGIYKKDYPDFDVRITPTIKEAIEIINAGTDVVALDATDRQRPEGEDLAALIRRIKSEYDIPVMADVATLKEGISACEAGADAVATTLSGYTPYTPKTEEPDLALVRDLSNLLEVPIVAEGRYWTPEQAASAIENGAYLVVIGSAITRPQMITERFHKKIKQSLRK